MKADNAEIAEIIGSVGSGSGFLMGLVAFLAGGIGSLLHIGGAFGYFLSSWLVIFLSILGGIGLPIARMEPLTGGIFMIVSGSVGIAVVGGFFIIPSSLLIVAGLIDIMDSFRSWNTVKI